MNLKIYTIIVLALLGIALAFGAIEVPSKSDYVQLIENTDQCFSCYTIYNICNPTEQAIAIDSLDGFNIKLYDKNGDRYSGLDESGDIVTNIEGASFDVENLELTYKAIEDYSVDVPDYVDCQRNYTFLSNETGKEETVVYDSKCLSGYHQEPRQRTVWDDFNSITKASLQPGECVEVKLSGNIGWRQAVDNVVSFAGQEFREYAWWNSSWTKRKMINITNNDGVEVLRKWHTLNFTLQNTTDVQDDGDDIRVTYNTSGTDVELDRVVTPYNSTHFLVEVRAQANISAGSTSTNEYWLYYSNPSAIAQSTNKSNVYLFWCDFSSDLCGLTEVDANNLIVYDSVLQRLNYTIDTSADAYVYFNISSIAPKINGYEVTAKYVLTLPSGSISSLLLGFGDIVNDWSAYKGLNNGEWVWITTEEDGWDLTHTNSTTDTYSVWHTYKPIENVAQYFKYYRLTNNTNATGTFYNDSAYTIIDTSGSVLTANQDYVYFFPINNRYYSGSWNKITGSVDDVKLIRRLPTNPIFALGTEEQQDADATESEGKAVIETGITNALGEGADVYTDQQIYIRYLNGTQSLGTFDKVASYGSQRWAFNYVTDGESFTNINSLGTTVNIWENQSLTTTQITNQVESFINSTKS